MSYVLWSLILLVALAGFFMLVVMVALADAKEEMRRRARKQLQRQKLPPPAASTESAAEEDIPPSRLVGLFGQMAIDYDVYARKSEGRMLEQMKREEFVQSKSADYSYRQLREFDPYCQGR